MWYTSQYDILIAKTERGQGHMSTIDQQFVEYIVTSLVENPDDVIVERIVDEKGVLLTLTVNPEDLGRVIGRRGATAQSLRTLLRALGTKNTARYNLKIVNNDNPDEVAATASSDDDVTSTSSDDTSDDTTTSDDATDEPVDNPSDEPVENDEAEESDYAKKSRQELAELDDLDI